MNYSKPEVRSNKSNGILIRSGKPTAIFSFVIFFCMQTIFRDDFYFNRKRSRC